MLLAQRPRRQRCIVVVGFVQAGGAAPDRFQIGDVLARVVACQVAVTPQDAVDALHYVDTVLVRQGHVRRVHDVLQLLQFPGRLLDDAGVACGDGRELRGREVLVADHAALFEFIDQELGSLPGVRRVTSSVVLRLYKVFGTRTTAMSRGTDLGGKKKG